MPALKDTLDSHVREAAPELVETLDRNRLRCYSCGHCCPIPEGQPGVCKVRFNRGGNLYAPRGYVGGVPCRPPRKKTFFLTFPRALSYSFWMLRCALHCS